MRSDSQDSIVRDSSGETTEGLKAISGFSFSFEIQDTGISRTVDFKPKVE